MIYCSLCLYPETKPDLYFVDGVCSACLAFEQRKNIDWIQREKEFKELCNRLKNDHYQYDCVVPVSGGKDSHYQILKVKEYGLNPLAVCAVTDHLSVLGRNNLDNISKLSCDVIEINTNTKLRRKINKYTLQEIGDISWAEHITIFTIPVRIAISFNIPLIVRGENPQNEYGGPQEAQKAAKLDRRWLEEYGGLNGLRIRDLEDIGMLTKQESLLYTYPDLTQKTTSGIFLGQYFPWDGAENALVACRNGFKTYYGPVEGTGYDYENLDNHQTGIHDYFKYLKYGFGRCTDIVCNHIRRGRITRAEGKEFVLMYDGRWPNSYLGMPLKEILNNIDMNVPTFMGIANQFANKTLFKCADGRVPIALFKKELENA